MAQKNDESTEKIFVSRLAREGASCGELTASLIWFDKSDLDLHIVLKTASGRHHISYRRKTCGNGQLDVDMNAGHPFSTAPVENIFFAKAKPGRYQVFVNNFHWRPGESEPAKVVKGDPKASKKKNKRTKENEVCCTSHISRSEMEYGRSSW